MSKRIALYDYVEVDHVDLSNFCSAINSNSEHAREDVSGFSASGSDEFLAGRTTQDVTGEFFGSGGSNEAFQVLQPLHRDKSIFPIRWRKNVNAGVSATNPELRGNVQLLTFPQGATRGEVEKFSCTFTPADATGLVWYET
jgi:hypothetical protein